MKTFVKILLGLAILLAARGVIYLLIANKPEAEVVERVRILPAVEVLEVKAEDRKMEVPSQGVVAARKVTRVAAEVGGLVVFVAEKFEKGGSFEKGEIMLELDAADYVAGVAMEEAAVAEARLALATEEARAAQAKRDWDNLGRVGEAKDLTLRKPQLLSARARVKAVEAALVKSKRNLERTKIKAPFTGRIRQVETELGAYLKVGNSIVEFYSTEPYELRMPVSLDELQFVKNVKQGGRGAEVEIVATAGGELFTWKGEVVRNEAEIERASRSIYLVALMEGRNEGEGVRLQPGLFVQTRIEGGVLKNAFQVPMKAFYDLDHVVVVDERDRIQIRQVKVVRREGEVAIVAEGLKQGERVCLTSLPDIIEGMEVRVVNESGDSAEGEDEGTGDQPVSLPKT